MVLDPGQASLLSQGLHVVIYGFSPTEVQDGNCAHLLAAPEHLQSM